MAEILASSMPTNRILLLVGNEIGQLREAGKLSDITYGLMDNNSMSWRTCWAVVKGWRPLRCHSPIP